MLLNEATLTLTDSVFHVGHKPPGTNTWGRDKMHRAIMAACNHFNTKTRACSQSSEAKLAKGTDRIDLSDQIPGLTRARFMYAEIAFKEVKKVPYHHVRRFHSGESSPTGRPTMLAFKHDSGDSGDGDDPALAFFDVKCDQEYTLDVTHVSITAFEPGTEDESIRLNIPDEYARDIIWFGGRGYLIRGAPGHPDQMRAMEDFLRVCDEAKERYQGMVV